VARPTEDPKTVTVQLRVTPAYLEAIDEWCARQEYPPSRSEAIRRLTMIALGKAPKIKAK
jgi:Arc/MetJ-type ribon-helix-helix transcriptional regulator